MKLNLGAGDDRREGYIGIDLRKALATDILADVRHLPFADGVMESVLCYDIIEHLHRYDIEPFLREVWRVMAPGGELFIKTPNLHELMLVYMHGEIPGFELERKLYGGQEYPENTHLTGFTPEMLAERLTTAGFKKIRIQKGQQGDWSNMVAQVVKP